MKRNWINLFFCVCLLLLSGCAASDNNLDPENPVTLTLWHYYVDENKIALEQTVDQFNQTVGMEQGVIVEATAKGSIADLEEAVTDSAMGIINAEPMPDIFSSYPDKAMEIDALGRVCDLTEYFTEEERALYVPDFLQDGMFDGDRLLVLPIVKSSEILYMNKTAWDAFTDANPDVGIDLLANWKDLYAVSRAFYQWTDAETPDIPWDGKSFMGIDATSNYIIIGSKQHGVNIIDSEGEQALLDHAALREPFAVYYEAYSLGYFNAVGRFRSDDIKSGDIAAYVGSTSGAAYFPTWIESNNQKVDIDFMTSRYPTFTDGEPYAIQQGAGMCVAHSTPQKEAAAALFLKWFTAPAQNVAFSMASGYLPVQQSTYTDPLFTNALADMLQGDKAQQNVAEVYEMALSQITGANTYAAQPFEGSYTVRSILGSTLLEAGEAGRALADAAKAQGLSEDEILQSLDTDDAFAQWIAQIHTQLETQGIGYSDIN